MSFVFMGRKDRFQVGQQLLCTYSYTQDYIVGNVYPVVPSNSGGRLMLLTEHRGRGNNNTTSQFVFAEAFTEDDFAELVG
jgi:hypothetical protein